MLPHDDAEFPRCPGGRARATIDTVKVRRKRHTDNTDPVDERVDLTTRRSEATRYPRLYRQQSGRVVAGVASGVAEHLEIPVLWVRATFVVLAAFGGAGILAYGLLWGFVPLGDSGRKSTTREHQQGIGLVILGFGLAIAVATVSALPTWLVAPLAAVLVGGAVVWREADETQRGKWRQEARSSMAGVLLGGGGRLAAVRILAGALLVLTGLLVFLVGNATVGELPFALVAVFATLIGAAVLTVPWWLRLVRDLNVERATRIRSQERAEIAAHLHDSVLQTLALIQKQADAEREVRRLARGQERELRQWLYGASGQARPTGHTSNMLTAHARSADEVSVGTLSAELARICGEVEDTFALSVQQVVVGDGELDESLWAMLAAAREAIINAAKHSGVGEVSVYAELQTDRAEVFVRDRGVGFDPESVASDRHGLADSIRGRMERNGGRVGLRTSPGEGTEIHLELPRRAGVGG